MQYWGLSCVCVCVCDSGFWLVLVTACWILSFQGLVVPNLPSVSANFWLFVSLQAVFFMVLVDFCLWLWLYLFMDSTWYHILLGTRPWFCISGRFHLWKSYPGAVAMAGPGGILRLSLKFANIGWSSIRYWLSIDWLLVIDQLLIHVLLLTHRHAPGSHRFTHTPQI